MAQYMDSMWLCMMHQYGLMLCIHAGLNDMHLLSVWVNSVHQASLWRNNLWLNAVQASIYGLMLCCSMHLARHSQVSSWHAVEHALSWCSATSIKLLCYSYQAGSMLCIRHQYGSILCIKHQL